MIQIINDILKQIKTAKPLVLNISNQVTMDFVANGLLSLGASPIMTQAIQEVENLVKLASAVVINTGTLNEEFLSLADYACMQANRWQKPLVLDPVGIGASDYRSSHCDRLLRQFNFQLIRGNASEIAALAGLKISSRGVDTSLCTESAVEGGKKLVETHSSITVISGAMDAVINRNQIQHFERGSALMPQVTGSGCLLTAVIALFMAVWNDHFQAACAAVLFYSLCGELAEKNASGPGSFKMHFLDSLAGWERLVA